MTMVRQRYSLVPSKDIDDQRIKESKMDHRHAWPCPTKNGSLTCCLPLMDISMQKYLRCQLITSKENDDQRILQSGWTRTKPGQTQSKVVFLEATFLWRLSLSKSIKISIDSFPQYWWSKNLAIPLDERHIWPYQTKISTLRYYFPLMNDSLPKN